MCHCETGQSPVVAIQFLPQVKTNAVRRFNSVALSLFRLPLIILNTAVTTPDGVAQ
ncbi:MAG: hypothetical protein J6V99_05740 [Neisseriaceae bacterium]|nr:hypothetical protein [Neisseriaceae bacterium]